MYYSNYNNYNSLANNFIWIFISLIVAIAGGILIYYLFLKNDEQVSDNLQKLKDILNFKTLLIEPILKIIYLILTIFVIIYSFSFIATNFLVFLALLIIAPILIRVIYESLLIIVMIWKNTKEINDKLLSKEKKKEVKEKTNEKEKQD